MPERHTLGLSGHVDATAIEPLLAEIAGHPPAGAPVTIDARLVRSATPAAIAALGVLLEQLRAAGCGADVLHTRAPLPAPHKVLLPSVGFGRAEAIHTIIDHVQDRAGAVMQSLGYRLAEGAFLGMMIAELAQNVLEHAEAPGWAAAWVVEDARRGRHLEIAIADSGIGFRGSLELEDDAEAMVAALAHGRSRFSDPGRGQGLHQVRHRVARWGGELMVRSGTARWEGAAADVPDMVPRTGLVRLRGVQVAVRVPERTR